MKKQTIEYSTPLDALIDLAKRLQNYENAHHMTSDIFFDQYKRGLLSDDIAYIEWSNDYHHYLALHHELGNLLRHAA
jgi:hypothetical protein